MTLNDYIKDVKRDWNDKQWLEYCSVHMHNPWISEEDRLYYKDKFTDLINKQVRGNYSDKTNKKDH